MKLYVLMSSERDLSGIYSSREKAEEAFRFFGSVGEIEEYELDKMEWKKDDLFFYKISMTYDGHSIIEHTLPLSNDPEWQPHRTQAAVTFSIWAKDADSAVQIANEKRMQLIANHQWTTNWEEYRDWQHLGFIV